MAERHHYLELLARASSTRENDMYIKGYLDALNYIVTGAVSQRALDVLGIEQTPKVKPQEDYMPREREVSP